MRVLEPGYAQAIPAKRAGEQLLPARGSASDAGMIESWAGGAGWSLGRGDIKMLAQYRPGGLMLGMLDGRPVSAIATTVHGNEFCFAGALVVDPGFRNRGVGSATVDLALGFASGLTIGLEAPPALRDLFAARGFYTRWRTIAYAGPVPTARVIDPHVLPLDSNMMGPAAILDARGFPASRSALSTEWATAPARHALGYVDRNRLLGYGVVRPGFGADRIGPLYACDLRIATAVFDALAQHAGWRGARAIAMDVPEPNSAAMTLCETRGLSIDTETLRMVRPGPNVSERPVDLTQLYGLTSREFG